MNSLNVSLTKQLLELVDQKVSDGLYQSASEVVREGLLGQRHVQRIHENLLRY